MLPSPPTDGCGAPEAWLPTRKPAGLAWRWTFLYYCEDLFMKNLEGESARPREMVVFSSPFLIPARYHLCGHSPPTQGTPTPVPVPLRNPDLPACLLLQGLSRPTWAPVKGWSEPSGVLGHGRKRTPSHINGEAPRKRLRDPLYFLNKRGLVFFWCATFCHHLYQRESRGLPEISEDTACSLLLAGGCTRTP